MPLDLYREATKDYKLVQVSPKKPKITAYGGTEIPVVGKVLLWVWQGKFKCRLDCKIVDQENIRPFLGRKACIGMEIVAYLDNDKLNKPATGTSEVYTVSDDASPLTKEQLIQRHPNVFGEGVGRLEGDSQTTALDLIARSKDLNQAIQHEHYPLPTATRLFGAKVFTVLDVH